ncbi:hypothetical protein C0993_009769 [Termitomyces sp. T159_Od127]|nr:hypothetical protein C0993_009769 [Termitomyces sp. T159_Od127]
MDVPVDLSRVLFVCTGANPLILCTTETDRPPSANNLETIPAPLLDRMEVLEVSGYVSEEKAVIAERYLAPQAREASGLGTANVVLDREAVDVLIKYYCRESGVRNLKKHIEKVYLMIQVFTPANTARQIYRKAALKVVQDLGEDIFPEPQASVEAAAAVDPTTTESTIDIHETSTASSEAESTESQSSSSASASSSPESSETSSSTPLTSPADTTPNPSEDDPKITTTQQRKPLPIPDTVHIRITPETLKDYVGPPIYQKDRMYVRPPPPGVSTGLGYLGNGSGAVMPVEAMSMPGKGGLQLTGKLGEVIRESAQIALSWVKGHAFELGITTSAGDTFLNERDVHVHMPEGSIGKEGPSAGTAILSAFVSLFTKTPVNPDIAMTGEISLVGQVLPVGGLKEKILAAHRAGMKTIIAPAANRADIEENVPESVKEGIRFVYVETVKEVLEEVFRDEPIAERWKENLS